MEMDVFTILPFLFEYKLSFYIRKFCLKDLRSLLIKENVFRPLARTLNGEELPLKAYKRKSLELEPLNKTASSYEISRGYDSSKSSEDIVPSALYLEGSSFIIQELVSDWIRLSFTRDEILIKDFIISLVNQKVIGPSDSDNINVREVTPANDLAFYFEMYVCINKELETLYPMPPDVPEVPEVGGVMDVIVDRVSKPNNKSKRTKRSLSFNIFYNDKSDFNIPIKVNYINLSKATATIREKRLCFLRRLISKNRVQFKSLSWKNVSNLNDDELNKMALL
jgi:hypothetical protein